MDERCPICQELIKTTRSLDFLSVQCRRCGNYKITNTAISGSKKIGSRERATISGWLRENEGSKITSDNLEQLRRLKNPSFHERADKLLMALEKKTTYAGECLELDKSWISLSWCLNGDELSEILGFLISSQRIDSVSLGYANGYKIVSEGWKYLEELRKINSDSQQGFVAMWFDDGLKRIYDDVIAQAILDAGYKPHRVDKKEHNNKIDDEIISEIRKSRFVLADFTGHRGGVYYEAGFAKGLSIEVFWTCRKDNTKDLHFDIRQFNCIDWESDKLEEFKERITLRIESVIGRGAYTETR